MVMTSKVARVLKVDALVDIRARDSPMPAPSRYLSMRTYNESFSASHKLLLQSFYVLFLLKPSYFHN